MKYLSYDNSYWCFDIEADSLNPKHIWCVVCENIVTGEVLRLREYADIRRFFSDPTLILIGHNILSYDVPSLNRLLNLGISFDRCVDTLVLSILYHPKMPGGHSLEAYGERFNFPKDSWNDFSQWSEGLEKRCVTDVRLNVRVYKALCSKMKKVGFSEKSCEIEHKMRVIINKQQKNGFKFDVPNAEILYARLRQDQDRFSGSIHELFPPVLVDVATYKRRIKNDGGDYATYLRHVEQYPEIRDEGDGNYTVKDWQEFNIGSPKQRLEKLLSLGFVPTKLTKGGNPSVDEDSIVEFAKESGNPQVAGIAEWLVLGARVGMVKNWLGAVHDDGCIRGNVNSCGASSRRMTHNSPNTANVPGNEAKYGEDVRSLWMARPGRVLVGADAKSAQMRCFAHYLPNPQDGIRFYTDGHDPHQENADLIGIKRKPIKNVFYANMFGAQPPKLALTAGFVGSKSEAKEYGSWIRTELYRVTPGLEALTKEVQREFRQTAEGWLVCLDGGYVRCPGEHAALNYKIQPAEAVLMKQAAIYADQRMIEQGLDVLKVGDIHDEWQHDVDPKDAEAFGKLCQQAMRDSGETFNLRVPFDGDYKIGPSWAQTH